MKSTIAVLAYNNQQMTTECQEAIEDEVKWYEKPELVLVDNGSDIPIMDRKGWRTIHYVHNVGNVQGQNLCYQVAHGDWIVFVSNDVIVSNRFWDAMKEPQTGQVMPLILDGNGSIQSSGGELVWPGYGRNINHEVHNPDYIPSICYGMLKSTWAKQGGFDSNFRGAYEDVDFGVRLGYQNLGVRTEARVYHKGNATLQYKNNSVFRRERRRFIEKHYRGLSRSAALAVQTLADIRG